MKRSIVIFAFGLLMCLCSPERAYSECDLTPGCTIGGPCTACVPDSTCPGGSGCCTGTGEDNGSGGCHCNVGGSCGGGGAACGDGNCDLAAGEDDPASGNFCCADCGGECGGNARVPVGDTCAGGCQGGNCFCNNAGCNLSEIGNVVCGDAGHGHP